MTFRDHLLVHQTLWASFAISLVLLVVLTVTGASINEVVIAFLAGIFAVSAVLAIIYQAFIYVKFRKNKRYVRILERFTEHKSTFSEHKTRNDFCTSDDWANRSTISSTYNSNLTCNIYN